VRHPASHTPSTSMPVCCVASDLGVRSGGDSHMSQAQARSREDGCCRQACEPFHVAKDTKVTIDTTATIETKVTNDTSTNSDDDLTSLRGTSTRPIQPAAGQLRGGTHGQANSRRSAVSTTRLDRPRATA
jgi:hypothetical protein